MQNETSLHDPACGCGHDGYTPETCEPTRRFWRLLNGLRGGLLAAIDRELAADERLTHVEMTASQLAIVAYLAEQKEPRRVADLCKAISYDAGAMTRMLDRLESKGVLRRARAAADRRVIYLQLTDEGREVYPVMAEIFRRVMNRSLTGFLPHEVEQFESYLRRMFANT